MAKVPPSSWPLPLNGGTGDEEFDHLLGFLDFPMESLESLEGDGLIGDWDMSSNSQYLGPIPSDVLIGQPMIAQTKTEPVFLHRQVGFNDGTIPETKQLPYRFEDTAGPFIHRQNKSTEVQDHSVFQSQSPVSVLENGVRINRRRRSKRARPSVNPWLLLPPVFRAQKKKPSQVERAKKTIADFSNYAAPQRPAATKKCAHCEVTKTPQWREGPMGPKTLCNACGVRYRSGRLYPEYRPAASPTFVPSVHSNSHKKVVEMRSKAKKPEVMDVEDWSMFGDLAFIPVSGYL